MNKQNLTLAHLPLKDRKSASIIRPGKLRPKFLPPSNSSQNAKELDPLKPQKNKVLLPSQSKLGLMPSGSSFLYTKTMENTKIVTLRIRSNWGDPSKLSISSFWVLGPKKQSLPLQQIILGYSDIVNGEYAHLVESVLDKTDLTHLFTISWPPKNHEYAALTAVVSDEYEIGGIRLWNSALDPLSGIRAYEVLIGSELLTTGEVPRSFGVDFYYTEPKKQIQTTDSFQILKSLFPDNYADPPIYDLFGRYPISETQSLRIVVVSSYDNGERFGLNGLEIVPQSKKPLAFDQIKDIKLSNCKYASGFDKLFKPNKITNDIDHMFYADSDWSAKPEILIQFKKPHRIIKLGIWNFNALIPTVRAGAKIIKIYDENKLIWSGKLQMGNGFENESIIDRVTLIPLIDIPHFADNSAPPEELVNPMAGMNSILGDAFAPIQTPDLATLLSYPKQ